MTITEALAEIKTIAKRIESKRAFICQYTYRSEGYKDPHEKDGGSQKLIAAEMQAVTDLENRIVELRRSIQTANELNKITIEKEEKTIADWLTWRRDVAPGRSSFLNSVSRSLQQARDTARRQGISLVSSSSQAEKSSDIIVNISEKELAAETEKLSNILGQLDGQLSLKNATVQI